MIAIPRDAATLILMRDVARARTGIEILLVRRHAKSTFMPGAYVFPGGAVETADYTRQAQRICHGLSFEQAQEIIAGTSLPEKALGFYVAAIRETFEEAGILLGYRETTNVIAFSEDEKARFARYRRQVRKDPFSFATIIEREGLKLATGNLFYFAHWITPEFSPIRFDARFFVSVAPSEQEALCDAVETTAHVWISPQKALKKQGPDFWLAPPTLSSITVLAQFSSVDEVIASAKDKDIPTVMG
jgi:8-oxo-dGTP pyrophosphatase MutT (NUDIX family)